MISRTIANMCINKKNNQTSSTKWMHLNTPPFLGDAHYKTRTKHCDNYEKRLLNRLSDWCVRTSAMVRSVQAQAHYLFACVVLHML
jgi:hypothetical protein